MFLEELPLVAHLTQKADSFFVYSSGKVGKLLASVPTLASIFQSESDRSVDCWRSELFWTNSKSAISEFKAKLPGSIHIFDCPLSEIPSAAIDTLSSRDAQEIIFQSASGWRSLDLNSKISINLALFADAMGAGLFRLIRKVRSASKKLVLKKYSVDLHSAGVGEYAVESGAAFVAQVPALQGLGDSNEGNKEKILFFEEMNLLSPHHAHADIRERGAGRYSLWGDTFYFSSSDGSDPRSNGRRYRFIEVDKLPTFAKRFLPKKTCLEISGHEAKDGLHLGSKALEVPGLGVDFTEYVKTHITDPAARGYERMGDVSEEVDIFITNLGAGGAERQMSYVVTALHSHGVPVRVLTYYQSSPDTLHYQPLLEKRGIPVQFINTPNEKFSFEHFASREGVEDLAIINSMPTLFRDEVYSLYTHLMAFRPKVLHCWLDHSNICGAIAGWLAGVPKIVLSSRSVNPTNFPHIYKDWYKKWYQLMAANPHVSWVANSSVGAASYAEWIGIPVERFQIVHNGLDLDAIITPSEKDCLAFRAEVGIPSDAPVITSVFRLSHEKRPLRFLRLVYEAKKRFPTLHAIIVGNGPLQAQVDNEIENLEMGSYVHLLGRRDDVPLIMRSSDIVTLTSSVEGLPNVLIEAEWLGKPVITTEVGNVVDIVRNGKSGYICSRDDFSVLLDKTLELLGDPEKASRFGSVGHDWVKQGFSLERMVNQMISAYGLDPVSERRESLCA